MAAAISDMYEVEAGKIARTRATNPDVKAFAAKMVQAHTETTAKLKSILGEMKHQRAAPVRLDDRRQGLIDDLRRAKTADFDARYISQQVDAHKEALIVMQGYAKDGDNAAVKSFAATTAMEVQGHLNVAEPLYKRVKRSQLPAGQYIALRYYVFGRPRRIKTPGCALLPHSCGFPAGFAGGGKGETVVPKPFRTESPPAGPCLPFSLPHTARLRRRAAELYDGRRG